MWHRWRAGGCGEQNEIHSYKNVLLRRNKMKFAVIKTTISPCTDCDWWGDKTLRWSNVTLFTSRQNEFYSVLNYSTITQRLGTKCHLVAEFGQWAQTVTRLFCDVRVKLMASESDVNVWPPMMMEETKLFMHSQLLINSIGVSASQFKWRRRGHSVLLHAHCSSG